MKRVPLNETPLEKEEKTAAACPAPKNEIAKTLSALADDYSELISERRKTDNLYFSESVPQPKLFSKADKCPFYEEDCKKITDGKYTVNGKSVGGSKSDCVNLIYNEKIEKQIIYEPYKKEPQKPKEPEIEKWTMWFDRPVLTILSIIPLALMIGAIVGIVVNLNLVALWGLLIGACVAAIIGMCAYSNGGFIGLIIWAFRYPKVKKANKQAMENYKSELETYEKAERSAQIEYDAAMQDYERKVKEANEEYNRKCDELHKNVLSAVEEYSVDCKNYFKRKKKAEEDNEKQKAAIKARYEDIARKIRRYPDIIPSKLLKVSEFENSSVYALQEVESEVKAYVDIFESGRADTLKEAINYYIADKQAEEQKRILEDQADEQIRQMLKQTCAMSACKRCRTRCYDMNRYASDGNGGCFNYYHYD